MIPKIIIQTWKDDELPENMRICADKIKKLNPDFEYKFFTDKKIKKFVKKNFKEYYYFFLNLKTIQKIDFFRYLAVYFYGGFYFDLDIDLVKPLESLCNYDFVLPKEHYPNTDLYLLKQDIKILLGNYAFGSKKNHPFLKIVIRNIVNGRISSKDIPFCFEKKIFYTTGPVLLTISYFDYLKEKNDDNDIIIIEPVPFSSAHFGDYGKHLELGTRRKE